MENVYVAVRSIKSNRLRSFLTILIIAIGMTSLVGVLTATDALKGEVFSNFEKMGTRSFSITSEKLAANNAMEKMRVRNARNIPYYQAASFKEQFSGQSGSIGQSGGSGCAVSVFAPLGSIPVKYGSANLSTPMLSIVAADEEYLIYKNAGIGEGRMIAEGDLNSARQVCVIGWDIAKSLFKGEAPIGKQISIAAVKYEVIGVLEKRGGSFAGGVDNEIVIPVTSARAHFISDNTSFTIGITPGGISGRVSEGVSGRVSGEVSGRVSGGVSGSGEADDIYARAEYVFRAVRRLSPGDKSDFKVNKSDAMLEELSKVTRVITVAAAVIGLITLLGAAIGLMNIMLVSVKERTQEIGIRKAIGASAAMIRQQFLIESVVISELGCLLGTTLGILTGNATAMLMGASFIIPWMWIFFAVVVCLIVGVASGYIPAKRAAALDPIEALRLL